MKRSILKNLFVISIAVILAFSAGIGQAGEKTEWSFVSMMMNTHPVVANAMITLFEKLNKESTGRLEITVFNPETVVPTPELYNAIQRGVANIGCFFPSRYPNAFPIATLGDYPFLFQSTRAASFSMAELLKNNPQVQKEFSKVKPYAFTSSTPLDIVSVKPIHKLEDLKGRRFGVMESASLRVVELLGGVPVLLNLSDFYIALQRGLVEGVVSPIPTYRSTKVCEVGKYVIKCNIKCTICPSIINLNSFNSLPDDIKALVDKFALWPNTALQSNWVEISTEKDLKWLIENNGVQVIEISPEEIARWSAAVKPVFDDWIAAAKKNGVENPEAILAELRSYAEKYNKLEVQIAETAKYKEVLGDLYTNYKEN